MPIADLLGTTANTATRVLAEKQLRALYEEYLRSGLSLEECHRRLQQASQPQITPPFTPEMGPPAPEPIPSEIEQLQGVAFLTPPESITEPDVVTRPRAAFQMPEQAS